MHTGCDDSYNDIMTVAINRNDGYNVVCSQYSTRESISSNFSEAFTSEFNFLPMVKGHCFRYTMCLSETGHTIMCSCNFEHAENVIMYVVPRKHFFKNCNIF